MKNMVIVSILAAMISLQGCTGSWVNVAISPIIKTPAAGTVYFEKNYQLHKRVSAGRGQVIISVRSYEEVTQAIFYADLPEKVLVEMVTPEAGIFREKRTIEIAAGSYTLDDELVADGTSSIGAAGTRFSLLPFTDNGVRWGLLVEGNDNFSSKGLYNYDNNKLWLPASLWIQPGRINLFGMSAINLVATADRNFDLIYSGRDKTSLQATLLEYATTDLSKPSSRQELFFDVNAGRFTVRGLTVEIHEASDDKLEYTVVKD